MHKKHILSLVTAFGLTGTTFATISLDLEATRLADDAGFDDPVNSLVMLIASTNDNLFSSLSALQAGTNVSVGQALGAGSDDFVVFRTNLAANSQAGLLFVNPTLDFSSVPGDVWGPGDRLALVWFKGGVLATSATLSTTTLTAGMRYNFYQGNVADGAGADGSASWVTPANGASNHKLYFFTTDSPDATGSNPAPTGRTSLTVVPEPSTLGMAALGVIGLMSRRRRN